MLLVPTEQLAARQSLEDHRPPYFSLSSLLSKEAVDMLDKIVAILHFLASSSDNRWRIGPEFRARFFELLVLVHLLFQLGDLGLGLGDLPVDLGDLLEQVVLGAPHVVPLRRPVVGGRTDRLHLRVVAGLLLLSGVDGERPVRLHPGSLARALPLPRVD